MIGFLPVINSKSITPKEKTSDRSLTLPVAAYSGAKYLKTKGNHSTDSVYIATCTGSCINSL